VILLTNKFSIFPRPAKMDTLKFKLIIIVKIKRKIWDGILKNYNLLSIISKKI